LISCLLRSCIHLGGQKGKLILSILNGVPFGAKAIDFHYHDGTELYEGDRIFILSKQKKHPSEFY